MRSWNFDTLLVSGGYDPTEHRWHRSEPIYPDAAVVQPDCRTATARFAGTEEGLVYARFGTDNDILVEKRVALLEGAEASKCFGSGLAAINCLLYALAEDGDHIAVQEKMYGGTIAAITKLLMRAGVRVTFIKDTNDPDEWKRACKKKRMKLLFAEILSNPTLEVLDVETISEIAKTHNAALVIDATFSTPVLFRPLDWGADYSIHSPTKFMNIGGTNTGGVLSGPKDGIKKVVGISNLWGAPLSAFDAWLTIKGMPFLKDRVLRQSKSAFELASFLAKNPRVKKIFYPKLMSSPDYFRAKKYLPEGCGAVFALELEGTKADAARFIESLKLWSHAVNLGDIHSLATCPALTTHSTIPQEMRERAGITDTFIRFSTGLEHIEDLKDDIDQALKK